MNNLRKLVGLLVVAALAAFTLPAGAASPQKIYSINVSALGTAPVAVTIKNETPNGNSTINSFVIQRPAGVTVSVANPAASAPASVSVHADGNVYVNAFDGLKSGTQTPKTITIYLNATYGASGPTCGSSYTWAATVYTGNSFGQETFAPVVGSPPTNATQSNTCSIAFTPPPPGSIVSGVAVVPAVGVTAFDGSNAPTSWSGSVTWTLNPQNAASSGSVSGGAPVANGPGSYLYPNLTITGTGAFTLTATTTFGAANSNVTTSAFTVYQGILDCEDPLNTSNPASGDGSTYGTPGFAAGKRHGNKDGSACVKVDYTFDNTVLANDTVHLSWDTSSQPSGVFDYTVFWRPEFVDPATGFPKRKTKVAWEVDGGGNPVYVYGNFCLSHDAPSQYTTLTGAGVDASSTTLLVSSAIASPPALPFAIVIGTERMTVTSLGTGTNWTVARGAGGTTAAAHGASAAVMSTPLPIDNNALKPGGGANPYLGKQDHMCIWDEEYQSTPAGSYDCSGPPTPSPGYSATNPVACIQRKTSVFDIGDGWMAVDQ